LGKYKDAIKYGGSGTSTSTWAIDLERLIKQAGYVKLADDQSLPENPYEAEINEEHREPASEDDVWLMAYNGFERAKSYMLKAGFRRVEL